MKKRRYVLEVNCRTCIFATTRQLDKAVEAFQDAPVGMFVTKEDQIKILRLGVEDG